ARAVASGAARRHSSAKIRCHEPLRHIVRGSKEDRSRTARPPDGDGHERDDVRTGTWTDAAEADAARRAIESRLLLNVTCMRFRRESPCPHPTPMELMFQLWRSD